MSTSGGRTVASATRASGLGDEGVDGVRAPVGQEDGAGLGAQRLDVTHPVVLLVDPGQLVLLDDVVEVVPAGGGGDQTDLDVLAPDLLVDVEVARRVGRDDALPQEAVVVLLALGVDGVGVEVGPGRQVDLGLADVQERVGVPGREVPGLLGRQDVVRRGGDEGGEVAAGTDAAERFDAGHDILRKSVGKGGIIAQRPARRTRLSRGRRRVRRPWPGTWPGRPG